MDYFQTQITKGIKYNPKKGIRNLSNSFINEYFIYPLKRKFKKKSFVEPTTKVKTQNGIVIPI